MAYFLPLFICLLVLPAVQGLKCYSCSYIHSGSDRDKECIYSPENVTTANKVTCKDHTVCYSKQVNRIDGDNTFVFSFGRGCIKEEKTECTKSALEETCFWFCNKDFCNSKNKSNKKSMGESMNRQRYVVVAIILLLVRTLTLS